MKLTVTSKNQGCGTVVSVAEEPYASALKIVNAANAGYFTNGVRMSAKQRAMLTLNFAPHLPRWQANCETLDQAEIAWATVRESGSGTMDIRDDMLAKILAMAAEITTAMAAPAKITYPCRGHSSGCCARVSMPGTYCPSCEIDR